MPSVTWPAKTREFHNHHFDSSVWNHFQFREDDIIIASYAKPGTTWIQQIVAQLLFEGADDLPSRICHPGWACGLHPTM